MLAPDPSALIRPGGAGEISSHAYESPGKAGSLARRCSCRRPRNRRPTAARPGQRPTALSASITASCEHPAWQCTSGFPSRSVIARLGLSSWWAGQQARCPVPDFRHLGNARAISTAVIIAPSDFDGQPRHGGLPDRPAPSVGTFVGMLFHNGAQSCLRRCLFEPGQLGTVGRRCKCEFDGSRLCLRDSRQVGPKTLNWVV
jgi:hypothetical protein